jgi:hypothetical protein
VAAAIRLGSSQDKILTTGWLATFSSARATLAKIVIFSLRAAIKSAAEAPAGLRMAVTINANLLIDTSNCGAPEERKFEPLVPDFK